MQTTSTRDVPNIALPTIMAAVERANQKLKAFTDASIHVSIEPIPATVSYKLPAGDADQTIEEETSGESGRSMVTLTYPPLKARGYSLVARFALAAIEGKPTTEWALDGVYDRSVQVDKLPKPDGSCGICGTSRARKSVWLLLDEMGEPVYAGGGCADDLGLTRAPTVRETEREVVEAIEEFERAPADAIRAVGVETTLGLVILTRYIEAKRQQGGLRLFDVIPGLVRDLSDRGPTPKELRYVAELRERLAGSEVLDLATKRGAITERALLDLFFDLERQDRLRGEEARMRARVERAAIAQKAGVIGKVGERLDVPVELVFTKTFPGYGPRDAARELLVFRVVDTHPQAGAVVKWWTSAAHGIVKGEAVMLRATVKSHGEYQGAPETTVTRATISGESAAERKERLAKEARKAESDRIDGLAKAGIERLRASREARGLDPQTGKPKEAA